MGLSAVIPVIHGLSLYGVERMESLMGLRWAVLEGLLYLTGAALYAVSTAPGSAQVPEGYCTNDELFRHAFPRDLTQDDLTSSAVRTRSSMFWWFWPRSHISEDC